MKNLVIGILLITTVVFGGLYFQQSRKATQAQVNAEGLQQKVSDLQSGVEEQEKKTAVLREELDLTRADVAARAQEATKARETLQSNLASQATLASQSQAATAKTASTNKTSSPLAEMFKNPQMKEMIKTQQKTALGAMVDKNYGKFFSDMHMTPEQSAAVKDMILSKQLAAADMGMSLFSDDMDAAKRAEMVQKIKTAGDEADAKLKEYLGEDNFTQYQAYEKSMAERMAISGFKDQLASGPNALSSVQEQQLMQAMAQERQSFKFTTDFADKSKFTGDFSMFTEDKLNTYFQELGQLNQQYVSRAQSLLSPDQAASFAKYLEGQQSMQKVGLQMAVKMFAPAKSGD
jgi:outer membrane murein-binding lipoprotein Lpp